MSGAADPELLQRIRALELKAREVADGLLLGIHHAPHRGRSLEFAEHKEYSPGDDLRRVDWKLFAKSDRYYVKEFEDDTNVTAVMAVDGSASMDYKWEGPGGRGKNGGPTKLDLARTLAGALSYLLLSQSDSVGLMTMAGKIVDYLPPRAKLAHFHEITARLGGLEPEKETNLAACLADLSTRLKERALIIILSDLLDEPEPAMKAIRLMRSRRHELVIFHVLDPSEIEFPFDRLSQFHDLEGPLKLLVDPRAIQKEYKKHFSGFLESVKAECAGAAIDYTLARTDREPASILSSWLMTRAASMGSRGRPAR